MVRDGRIDVNGIDFRIFQQFAVISVSRFYVERIANGIQLFGITLADGVHVGVGMALINGNEFSPESQSDDGNVDFSLSHGCDNF